MIKIIKVLEDKFWIPISFSLLIGLAFPTFGKGLNSFVIPILMLNFFLACLKINVIDVIEHIKRPKFIIYILVVYLLFLPVVFYYVFHFLNPEIAVGMLLLASMPTGVSAVVLTDIFEGDTSLSMAVSILAYLFSPFTISILFFILTQKQIHLDLLGLFKTLLLINFIPLFLAQIIVKINKKIVEKTQSYYSFVSIFLISFMVYILIAIQSDKILHNAVGTFIDVLWIYALFIALFILGYFSGFWRKKEEKIALAVSKTYMNNALAAGIAVTFFSPQIALLMVLSEVPWATTLGLFKYMTKHLD